MTEAQLLARLQSCARYWLGRYRHLRNELEVAELVAEGWLAWSRSGTWVRAEGAIRDLLRSNHSTWKQNKKHETIGQGEPGTVQISAPENQVEPCLVLPKNLSPRERLTLEGLAQGKNLTRIRRDLGLESNGSFSQYAARAKLKIESARIRERRQAAGMDKRRPIPSHLAPKKCN